MYFGSNQTKIILIFLQTEIESVKSGHVYSGKHSPKKYLLTFRSFGPDFKHYTTK